jgi:hypothetical protein
VLLGNSENPIHPDQLNKELIRNMAMYDPVLYAILNLHYNGAIDWEQALIYMVYMKKGELLNGR